MPIARPNPDEYAPFYAGYIQRVPEGDVFEFLTRQIDTLKTLLADVSEQDANFRYAPDQWSIKEVVGHVNDTERVFSYRALRISRGDTTPLAGFDQDDYVRGSNFADRMLQDLVQEFEYLRRANLLAFQHLPDAATLRRGTASEKPISVRALIYMMGGHADTHIESLRTEYLPGLRAG